MNDKRLLLITYNDGMFTHHIVTLDDMRSESMNNQLDGLANLIEDSMSQKITDSAFNPYKGFHFYSGVIQAPKGHEDMDAFFVDISYDPSSGCFEEVFYVNLP